MFPISCTAPKNAKIRTRAISIFLNHQAVIFLIPIWVHWHRLFTLEVSQFFLKTLQPMKEKTFGICSNWTQVLLLIKRLLEPLDRGSLSSSNKFIFKKSGSLSPMAFAETYLSLSEQFVQLRKQLIFCPLRVTSQRADCHLALKHFYDFSISCHLPSLLVAILLQRTLFLRHKFWLTLGLDLNY